MRELAVVQREAGDHVGVVALRGNGHNGSPNGAGVRGLASFPGVGDRPPIRQRRGPNIGGRDAHCALTSSGARKPLIQLPFRQPR